MILYRATYIGDGMWQLYLAPYGYKITPFIWEYSRTSFRDCNTAEDLIELINKYFNPLSVSKISEKEVWFTV